MRFLKRRVDTIFIMLGNSCNLNCVYCLQHPLVHKQIHTNINKDIYSFIKQLIEENEDSILSLHFYGGEPLLYFQQIKDIVEATREYPNLDYSVISNSKLLTDDMVEFFNKNNFRYAVSWDGVNTLKTRGFDAFDIKSPVRRRLLRLNRLCLTGVLSAKNYPIELLDSFQEIAKLYYDLNKHPLNINIDEVFDTGLSNKEILDIDYDRVVREVKTLFREYLDFVSTSGYKLDSNSHIIYMSQLVFMVSNYINGSKDRRSICNCRNGYSILNMDLDGNLYPCHNTSDSIGSIYDDYFKYLNKLITLDNTKEFYPTCSKCIAYPMCHGGCKLVSKENRELTYCKFKKSLYGTVIKCLQDYGAGLLCE